MQNNFIKMSLGAVGLATVALTASTSVLAQTTAASIVPTGVGYGGNYSGGWEFTANSDITVTSLGYWDQNLDGFASAHQVGIYSASGTLLTSTSVDSSDPLTADFRYHNTTPYKLTSGASYFIMGAAGSDNYVYDSTLTTDPAVTFVGEWYNSVPDGTLKFPDILVPGRNGYFGPNFEFSPASAVPDGASLNLLIGGLLPCMGVFALRRKFRR